MHAPRRLLEVATELNPDHARLWVESHPQSMQRLPFDPETPIGATTARIVRSCMRGSAAALGLALGDEQALGTYADRTVQVAQHAGG